MNIAHAETEIVSAFRTWAEKQFEPGKIPTGNDAFRFFGELRTSHSELLNFKCSGDKWQRVHIWLRNRDMVSD